MGVEQIKKTEVCNFPVAAFALTKKRTNGYRVYSRTVSMFDVIAPVDRMTFSKKKGFVACADGLVLVHLSTRFLKIHDVDLKELKKFCNRWEC